MKKFFILSLLACAVSATAQRAINFNADWQMRGKTVTLPRAWNEAEAFKVRIAALSDDTVRYTKTFVAPKAWKGKKVFVEFEGARQAAEVWLNGNRLGLHENGVMAFGFDLTPYLKAGKANRLEVMTDNSWSYKERGASTEGESVADGNSLPNNTLEPASFQWNNKNFNANYGGLPKNVRLHVVGRLYQTLPLYSTLGTTGVYVYATEHDVTGHAATIHAESQVRNETGKPQTFTYEVEVVDRDGSTRAKFSSSPYTIGKGETKTVAASQRVEGLHFWSWGYGYLYDVKTRLVVNGSPVDETTTTTGFRKTAYENGQTILNDRTIMMHGYAQRTSNEWPGVGMSVPAWLSDYSNGLMVASGGNLVRWMHVCPWKQDIESCDRVGLIQAMPAGDAEKDVTGRHWEQRVELMRDAIIYNRNNPSILFYECGNKGITEEHMREMKALRDEFDPHGGRAIGCREMLNNATAAEYGGEMLYINKSAGKPVWAMEYCRDEALRRYWDDWSYPYHKHGVGPLYRGDDASAYNQNNDQFAVEMVRRWFDYWQERPGTGERVSNGGTKIVFSDTNTHNRSESNYRTSGVVDAMRLPKDAFYAHQVMWNGWVTPEQQQTHIVGHWNYEPGTVKPVFVVSDAPKVKLYVNGQETGTDSVAYHFLHIFNNISYHPGTIKAVSYDAAGEVLSSATLETVGDAVALKLTNVEDHQLVGDGADMALLQVEAVDTQGRRHPLAHQQLTFSISGPIEWIGGIGKDEQGTNCIRSLSLPLECGVNRVFVRSTGGEGTATVTVKAEGLGQASISLEVKGTEQPRPQGLLTRGETPDTPSYKDLKQTVKVASIKAGCNQENAICSIDDSEDTEWKNDGRASTAWIRYDLAEPTRVDEVAIKLTGWRKREYPLLIFADNTLVWEGKTPVSLGYVHLPLATKQKARSITIKLKGTASDNDQFGNVKELAEPVANELDLFKAKDGDKVKSELRIVEVDFLQHLKEQSLVILYENDVHCAIDGYTRMAGLRDAIADTAAVCMVSSGDFLQGGTAGAISKGQYIVDIMASMDYDAITLGNHEFDYKVPHMISLLEQLPSPIVCTNFKDMQTGKHIYQPYVIKQMGTKKVAFIGTVTPSTMETEAYSFYDEHDKQIYDLQPDSAYQLVQQAATEARENGADYVVVLAHLGEDKNNTGVDSHGLASSTCGIDVILDGHTHSVIVADTVMNPQGKPVIVSQTGTKFANVGKLLITTDGHISTTLLPLKSITQENGRVTHTTDSIKQLLKGVNCQVVAKSDVSLRILDDKGRQAVRLRETNVGDLVTDAYRFITGADVALTNGGGIRIDLPAGNITYADIIALLPYDNYLCTLDVKGSKLMEILRANTRQLPQEDGQFPQTSGLRYTVHTGSHDVTDVAVQNRKTGQYEPLELEKTYKLATIDYCITGGGFANVLKGHDFTRTAKLYSEALVDYLKKGLKGHVGNKYAKPQGRITVLP